MRWPGRPAWRKPRGTAKTGGWCGSPRLADAGRGNLIIPEFRFSAGCRARVRGFRRCGWRNTIEVFPGNTQDGQTFYRQLGKAAERSGGGTVTFAGDRGMIRTPQIVELQKQGGHNITAPAKPQLEASWQRYSHG